MGNFDWSSVVTGGSGLLGSIISSVGAKRALNKQIDYNKWAQLNQQQFNAEEAQKARDFQTEFYEQYQSPSAMVKQYQEAGLNPALAYNGGTNTPPSATSASSGMSSITPQNTLQSFEHLGGMIGNMFLLKAQIDKMESEAEYSRSLATGQDISNKYADTKILQELRSGEAGIKNLNAATEKALNEASTELERKGLVAFQKILARAERDEKAANALVSGENALLTQWKNQFIKDNGYSPDSGGISQVMSLIGSSLSRIGAKNWGIGNLFDILGLSKK